MLPGSFLANFSRTSLPCSREIGQQALGYLLPRGNGSARAWRWRSRQSAVLVISHYRFVVLPCGVFISVEQKTPGNLEPEAWVALRRVLDLIQAAGAGLAGKSLAVPGQMTQRRSGPSARS